MRQWQCRNANRTAHNGQSPAHSRVRLTGKKGLAEQNGPKTSESNFEGKSRLQSFQIPLAGPQEIIFSQSKMGSVPPRTVVCCSLLFVVHCWRGCLCRCCWCCTVVAVAVDAVTPV